MKKVILLLSFVFLSLFLFGQSYYDAFATPGLVVGQASGNIYIPGQSAYYFDTIEYQGAFKRFLFRDSKNHSIGYLTVFDTKLYQTKDTSIYNLLFDTNWNIGDTIKNGTFGGMILVSKTSITLANGEIRDKFNFERYINTWGYSKASFVSGIGHLEGGLFPWSSFEGGSYFVCAKINGNDLYINPDPNVAQLCNGNFLCKHPYLIFDYTQNDKTITITNLSRYADQFTWKFGDGNSSSQKNPTHTYQKAGCYTVELTAIDKCPTSTNNKLSKIVNGCSETAWKVANDIDSISVMNRFKISPIIEFINTTNSLLKSMDGGFTFKNVAASESGKNARRFHEMLFWDDQRGVAFCDQDIPTTTKSGIIITNDGGESWTPKVPGSYSIRSGEISSSGGVFAAQGPYNNTYFRSLDFGQNWDTISLGSGNAIIDFFHINGDTVYAVAYKGFWQQGKNTTGHSYDNGKSWIFHTNVNDVTPKIYLNSKLGFGIKNQELYKSLNGGKSFTKIPLNFKITNITVINENTAFLTSDNGLVYMTLDHFQSFTTTNCSLGNLENIKALNDTIVYATIPWDYRINNKVIAYDFIPSKLGCSSEIDYDGDGYSLADDCDDENANINPSMIEIPYNSYDDDCNPTTLENDLDQDGYALGVDCDDQNTNINPSMIEIPYNSFDDDCNPTTLENDLDQDGYALGADCDDQNANINPSVTEIPYNSFDDDCNPTTLENDLDGDGYALGVDCDDQNANINPSVTEIPYNSFDDDCNPSTLENDLDGDGYALGVDCDDQNANINPSAIDISNNGIDEDCNGEDFISSTHDIPNNPIILTPNILTNNDNNLVLRSHNQSSGKLEIYNQFGRLLFTKYVSTNENINVESNLVAGICFVIFKSNDNSINSKFVLVKL
jgi:photosystem II stability/assembly factor-like uncharacterized protein